MKRLVSVAVMVTLLSATLTSYMEHRPFPFRTVQAAPAIVTPMRAQTIDPTASKAYVAALDVARVFGRSAGCAEADAKLITNVANEAVKAELDPRILAATIAVESGCNQYATSTKGAIGLTQVMPKIWKDKYNFEHDYNLLNPTDNVRVGASILSSLIKQYGTTNGLRRYNGLGVDCESCDAGYPDKIMGLSGRR